MNPFPDSAPAAEILAAIRRLGPSPLGPGTVVPGDWRERLGELYDAELVGAELIGGRASDPEAAACVRSGLLLMANDLDVSHTVSQAISTADGSFWHGIMHRREPDFGNSKYWFRKVGSHPAFPRLADHAGTGTAADEITTGGGWDAFRFVDLVEACERRQRPELRDELIELQELEMHMLLEYVYRKAIGN